MGKETVNTYGLGDIKAIQLRCNRDGLRRGGENPG